MFDRKCFTFWCSHVLPLVYDESLSYYEQILHIYKYVEEMRKDVQHMGELLQKFDITLEEHDNAIKDLQNELEKIKNGEYMSVYIEALAKWIDENLQELVKKIVKYIFFGLTNDGYFCAYIPNSWDFLKFDTILEPNSPLYGHLILNW